MHKVTTIFIIIFFLLFPVVSETVCAKESDAMVRINGGTFWMGSDSGLKHEAPVHQVTIEEFLMDQYPVTNEQYAKFVKETGYVTYSEQTPDPKEWPGAIPEMLVPASIVFKIPDHEVDLRNHYNWWEYLPGANWQHPEGPDSSIEERENNPVVHVTFDDANKYCQWDEKSIPTEAQFEFAARGGLDKKIYTWGDQPKHLKEKIVNFWQGDFPYKNENSDGYLATSP